MTVNMQFVAYIILMEVDDGYAREETDVVGERFVVSRA